MNGWVIYLTPALSLVRRGDNEAVPMGSGFLFAFPIFLCYITNTN